MSTLEVDHNANVYCLGLATADGSATFSVPIKVNSLPGSAIAAGNIRGAHIAIGRNGRVHVA